MIIWCDTETTGLDPAEGCLLEVTLLITDDDLMHRAWKTELVKPAFPIYVDTMIPIVQEMHTKNGLLDDLRNQVTRTHEQVEEEFLLWLDEMGEMYDVPDWGKTPMAGSSILHDRIFLRKWMPTLEAKFHYRSIDVSSFKEVFRRWYGESEVPSTPDEDKAHRSLADVRASIAELKDYRERFFIG